MTNSRATAAATFLAYVNAAAPPPTARTRTISSVAYATDEIGSDAKIGSASHFGSSVSWSCWLRSGRPTKSRFTLPTEVVTVSTLVGLDRSERQRDVTITRSTVKEVSR